jgi:hypothetical protein
MITVALPTWNNKDIVWLTMEGLIRQKNSPEWELIILECRSENESGSEFFQSYWPKLQKVGCVRMKYMYSLKRLPLNLKWVAMAQQASCNSEMFLLQGSDDYPHPTRNEQAAKHNVDWYDCRKYYQYHIALEKMIAYDNGQTEPMEPKEWKTGFNMAIKTDLVRNIQTTKYVRKGVDFWLFTTAGAKSRFVDQEIYNGLSTTGLNTISNKRYQFFLEPKHPFQATDIKPEDLKIPKTVLKRLYELKDKAVIDQERLDNREILVKFTKPLNGRLPGHKQYIPVHAMNYFLIRDAIEVIYHDREPQKDFDICK